MRLEHLLIVLSAGLLGACTSTARAGCKKADECNFLNGQSVDECTEKTQKALDNMTSGQRSDCEKALNNCIDMKSCSDEGQCAGEVKQKGTCPGVF